MSDDNRKVPSQVFRWFEKMKNNYEHNIKSVLQQFELFSANQQARLDKSNQEHISNLKQVHQAQLEQNQANTHRLHNEIEFYKQQIASQQLSIEQLNQRYDTVLTCLFSDNQKHLNIKDIFSTDLESQAQAELMGSHLVRGNPATAPMSEPVDASLNVQIPPIETPMAEQSCDQQFSEAVQQRQAGNTALAFQSFLQLAKAGYPKAMGAMGRCYFIAEGTEQDHAMGLAWLICAARLALPQAISRVEHFQQSDPELYQQAQDLAETLY